MISYDENLGFRTLTSFSLSQPAGLDLFLCHLVLILNLIVRREKGERKEKRRREKGEQKEKKKKFRNKKKRRKKKEEKSATSR